MSAESSGVFTLKEINRIKIIQDVIERRITTRLAASRLEKSDRHYQRLLERYHEQGHFHLLTGGVARLVWPCHERIEHHRYLCQYQFIQGPWLAKPPRHDFDVHRPLESDENLVATFT